MNQTLNNVRRKMRSGWKQLVQQIKLLHRRSKTDTDVRRLGIIGIIAAVMLVALLPPIGLAFLLAASLILIKG